MESWWIVKAQQRKLRSRAFYAGGRGKGSGTEMGKFQERNLLERSGQTVMLADEGLHAEEARKGARSLVLRV